MFSLSCLSLHQQNGKSSDASDSRVVRRVSVVRRLRPEPRGPCCQSPVRNCQTRQTQSCNHCTDFLQPRTVPSLPSSLASSMKICQTTQQQVELVLLFLPHYQYSNPISHTVVVLQNFRHLLPLDFYWNKAAHRSFRSLPQHIYAGFLTWVAYVCDRETSGQGAGTGVYKFSRALQGTHTRSFVHSFVNTPVFQLSFIYLESPMSPTFSNITMLNG